ncbi:MAG: hypothetical protein CBB68_05290 [Rhodospirillaceae bacterium TMED8]|nr:hypothetical protein [Magnetovibrio sp.]OUT51409.1 MAG: hypothetical protein CBB68_05290 [Rhodospirillaceae bacterium TMED8]
MCSISEALFYVISGTLGTLAVGILWMKLRGDHKEAKVGIWLGVLGFILVIFFLQDWICGWPLAI